MAKKTHKKRMEKEKIVTAVLTHTGTTHPLKTLFPKNKENATAAAPTANYFFGVQVKLMIISV